MRAMILITGVLLQQRMHLVLSLCCLLFILPLFTYADSPSDLRGAMNIMEANSNETGPPSYVQSRSFRETSHSAKRKPVKYTNRRLLDGEMCTKFDISIFQGPGSPLPNGIPTFSVQIFNLCTVGCPISNVHVACGWFASAKLVNPKVFRRVKYNDCLVNDGNPIPYGDSITFQNRSLEVLSVNVRPGSFGSAEGVGGRSKSPGNMLSPDEMVQRTRYTNRRILAANMCTNKDISIFQGRDTSSGIPQYIVQISNTCLSDCAPSDIHVFCDVCTNKDISITQRRDGSVGIPQYSVQIVNTCMSECAPSDIHVYCGWFASSPPPNPNTFTRIAYNDCLVNGGRALNHGSIIQFEYANSFMYPLRFKSAKFCR